MKIAVGYARASTDLQDGSIPQQKQAIEKWAKENAFKVIEWFEDEGRSGTNYNNRPAFMRMVHRAENSPNFEYILVYDESRWGRGGNPRHSNYWKVHFEFHKVIVRIINSQSKQENDIGSYVVEVVESAEASEYSKKLSRSTLRGCIDNALKGYSNGGTAPYGYRRMAINKETGEIVRELQQGDYRRDREEKVVWDVGDETEVRTVQKIYELKSLGYGYRSIANQLNTEKISCPQRGKWRNKNQLWSSGTIQSIITNPSYCGDRVYNRHPLSKKRVKEANVLGKTKDRWISDEYEWSVRKDAHPPIVSRELFVEANHTQQKVGRVNQHHYESPYLLSGLVKCDHCGFNYQGQSYTRQNKFYYVDGGNMNKGKSVCDRLSIRKEKLEGFVLDLMKESLPFSKATKRFEEMISEYLKKRTGKNGELEAIIKSLKNNEQKMQNLLSLVEKGIGLETVLERIKTLERERIKIDNEKLKAEQLSLKHIDVKNVSRLAAKFLLDFEKRFDKVPIQEKKEMIRQVVLGVRVNPETRVVTCAITKIPMVNRDLTSLIKPSEFYNLQHTVGANCSGGRT